METVRLALNSMNTRFELVLHGDDAVALRAAGEEAMREIERIEQVLSAFRSTSEIARINARAAIEGVQVSPEVFQLLLQSRDLWELTDGAFDVTVGSLMRCWGFREGKPGRLPDASAVETASATVGMEHLELDSRHRTVRFRREGVTVDLGAIGKGYAIDRAAGILRESGVHSGLLHGGTSTSYAIGAPPDQSAWCTVIHAATVATSRSLESLPMIGIRDEALSVSSISEKSFLAGGKIHGHVLDPRKGRPVDGVILASVSLPSATEADALSTALMVLGVAGLERLQRVRAQLRALILGADGSVSSTGLEPLAVGHK